jgi:TolA-binding protein
MTSVADAQQILAGLRSKQVEAETHAARLVERRKGVAFLAYTGDEAARKRLDELNNQIAANNGEIESLKAATVQAEERLAESQQREAEQIERERERSLGERTRNLRASAVELDAAAKLLVEKYTAFRKDAGALRALGVARLNDDLVSNATRRALHAYLQGTDLTLERLAPNQRYTFAWLVESWTAGILIMEAPSAPAT